ncbi:MAG: hypothetical protein IIB27_01435 [Chloroflexi bacterium]|nr:hypothetical protein [Chloroflexota bacterium]
MNDFSNDDPGHTPSDGFTDGSSAQPPDQAWLYERTIEAIANDPELVRLRLKPLTRFNTNVTGRAAFIKIYFGISCECSTAAVLSVEAAADKTRDEFREALPALLGKLKLQAFGFRRMDCDSHLQMRIQNLPGAGRP